MWLRFLALVLGLSMLLGAYAYIEYDKYKARPIGDVALQTRLLVERGDGLGRIISKLQSQGYNVQPDVFKFHARVTQQASDIRAGEYEVNGAMTPDDLLALLRSDQVVQYRFTLIEGWNIKQLVAALKKSPDLDSPEAPLDALSLGDLHPEGQFLPETYHFVRGTSSVELLKRAHKAMQSTLDELWAKREKDLPLKTPYEALILASIIEKESGVADERPQISGVFINRLRKGMKLQTDPTVIYGMGDSYKGNIRRKDLRTDTPYNTYTRKGLPPTPIAMPSRDAIEAALHPAKTDALFFVAMADGSGRHKFSKTLAEHEAAVRKYLLKK